MRVVGIEADQVCDGAVVHWMVVPEIGEYGISGGPEVCTPIKTMCPRTGGTVESLFGNQLNPSKDASNPLGEPKVFAEEICLGSAGHQRNTHQPLLAKHLQLNYFL